MPVGSGSPPYGVRPIDVGCAPRAHLTYAIAAQGDRC
jgi:hypothetical protein